MTTPLRLLHVHSGNLFGGVETILTTLATHRHLQPDIEHHLAVCFDERLATAWRQAGAPVHQLFPARVSRPWTVFRARRRLSTVLREERINAAICHSPWSLALFGSTVRALNVPLIYWQHGAVTGKHWLERWAKTVTPSAVICNSRFTKSTLPLLYSIDAEVIYPPIPFREDANRHVVRRNLRAMLEVSHETVVIIQVGRLELGKGFDMLLYALARLPHDLDWTAWLVGGGNSPRERRHEQELRGMAAELDLGARVRFLGMRDDIPQLLMASDIFAQPNTKPEGFGLAVVEAMHTGLPVVTSRLGAALEIVSEECGVLVPPGWPERLADDLEKLIRAAGQRKRLGEAGRRRALQLCAPAQQLTRLGKMLQREVGEENRKM